MALNKLTYVDNVTVIPASNLNAIQDEVIANATAITQKADQSTTYTKTEVDTAIGSVESEVEDIRVGADGTTYSTAGDAVRGQVEDAKTLAQNGEETTTLTWEYGTIDQNTGQDASDGLTTRCRTSGYFKPNGHISVDRSDVPYRTYLYYYDKDKNFIIRSDGYTDTEIIPNQAFDYFRMAVLNHGDSSSNITTSDCSKNIKIVQTTELIKGIQNNIAELKRAANNLKLLRIGTLVNGHLTASGVIDDDFTNYRLSTKEVVAYPNGANRKIIVHITSGYLFAVRSGAEATNLNHNLYWYRDGDSISIPDGDNYYAISICKEGTNTSHKSFVINTSDDFELSLFYTDDYDILNVNDEASRVLNSARLFFSANELNSLNKYAVIAHTSDCHGDYKRVENFLRYCDNENVDMACITGDIVAYKPSHQIEWFNDLLLSHNTLSAVCTGNHDVYDDSMTDSDIYDFMFADISEKIGNLTGKTWYYTDISSKKVRCISVNLYQYGGTNRWYTHFTNEQLEWLVTTLANTPNDYGIIIMSHAPQVNLNNAKDSDYPEFYQDVRLYNNTHNSVSDGVPLYDIVDAFISRTTLSKTYTQTGDPDSVTVTADFTSVDASVEFIAHLTGHFHQDTICYVPNRTNKQLMLNVTCTNAIYGGASYPYLADIQDQGRNCADSTQDAFNVYVLDRDNKLVKVVRIGSNMTYTMADRKYMEIPYAD